MLRNIFTAVSTALLVTVAPAQTTPNKPITLVVGYTPGGSVDLAARTLAPGLSKRLGQTVIVENVGGAGGALGAQKAATAAADGHTLLLGTSAEIAVNKLVSSNAKYDGLVDLVPVGLVGSQPLLLVAIPSLPANDIAGVVDLARKSPGKLAYGSAGNASLPHLTGELFAARGHLDLVHVPYKGAAPMMADLLGSNIQLGMLVLSSAMPQVKAGKLKPIAVSEPARAALLPNVPAFAESKEFAGFDISVFFGVFVRAGTPAAVQSRIAAALAETMNEVEVKTKLTDAGFTVRALDPLGAQKYIAAQAKTYRDVVDRAKIKD